MIFIDYFNNHIPRHAIHLICCIGIYLHFVIILIQRISEGRIDFLNPVMPYLQILRKNEIALLIRKIRFVYHRCRIGCHLFHILLLVQMENLSGAVFDVFAAEDIYTADFQKDENGNRMLEYQKGEKVDTLTTNEKGEASLSDLPLGTYEVVEVTAPEGFVLNETPQKITFTYKDQHTPVIEQTAAFVNDRQKVEISVVKKDAETGAIVEGATFGLYEKRTFWQGKR